MAFRIHDSVARGVLDNRVKGLVRGKIWIAGRCDPLVLELKGNAWPDLAGCVLTFTNPHKHAPDPSVDSLNQLQWGVIGDITASRKVRVFDVPMPEAYLMCKRGEKPPEHMANSLYIEWFSEANGRVVIESTDYELHITAPVWHMTRQEEQQRALDAANGMNWFMQRLTDAIERHKGNHKDPEEDWDEYDYENFLKESDARTDKYMELLDKYGDSEEAERRIAREMGWEDEPSEAECEQSGETTGEDGCAETDSEDEPQPDPAREGIDWIRTPEGYFRHPLQFRCSESALRFWKRAGELGFEEKPDKNVDQFVFEFQTAGAKLAGALNGIAEGRETAAPAFTVACLKRALNHLHKSLAGLEAVMPLKLLPDDMVAEGHKELFEIREGILKLMDEFRRRR